MAFTFGNHAGEQSVACDIEGNSQAHVSRPLVHLPTIGITLTFFRKLCKLYGVKDFYMYVFVYVCT